jgi:GR25 family glycosyltransferase involved in LPS biosynthesis
VRKYYDEPEITIFEDDIVFTSPESWKKYWEWKQELPENWDVYLGGLYSFNKKEEATENLQKIRGEFGGLHWYTIRKKFYDTFLASPEKSETGKDTKHIDRWIGYNNVYVYAPRLLPSRQMENQFEKGAYSERIRMTRTRSKGLTNYQSLRNKHKFL